MRLSIQKLHVSYGERVALNNINLELAAGEVVAVSGRNGAGRSTLLKAIAGQVGVQSGSLLWQQVKGQRVAPQELVYMPAFERASLGIAWMPETKEVFLELTTQENLLLGCGSGISQRARLDAVGRVYARYPMLAKRALVRAGTLSGGEQQLLAFMRAVICKPFLLLLDEPVEGLAAPIVQQVQQHLEELKKQGSTILLVEQKRQLSQAIADRMVHL